MNRKVFRAALSVCLLSAGLGSREAPVHVSLPSVLSDHMVLQQRTEVPLWGSTDRGRTVSCLTAGATPPGRRRGGEGRVRHQDTGQPITTHMFYDGDGTWKFRFTAVQTGLVRTGTWLERTEGHNPLAAPNTEAHNVLFPIAPVDRCEP